VTTKKSVHMYPTLRCNGRCPYCSNVVPGVKTIHEYQERLPGHWIKFMRVIQDWEIYFTGGEVFLFQGFTEILESVPNFARIYTNAMMIDAAYLGRVDPARVLFRCSYHPSAGPVGRFVDSLNILKQKNLPFQIYMVDSGNGVLSLKTNAFRKDGYEIGIDYNQRRHPHREGKVRCFIPSNFVGPDGTVFNCVSKMLRNKGGMGNVFEGYQMKEPEQVVCAEPGMCSPCDLAASYQEVL